MSVLLYREREHIVDTHSGDVMEELEVNGPEGHEREEEMSVWSGIIPDARASGHASLGEGWEARVHVGRSDFQPGWAG